MKTKPLYTLEACNFVWISAESISQMSAKIGSCWWEAYIRTEEGKQSQCKLSIWIYRRQFKARAIIYMRPMVTMAFDGL